MARTATHAASATASNVSRQFDRRVIVKASAAFAAAAALARGGIAPPKPALALDGETRAGEWSAPEGVGGDGTHLQFTAEIPFRAIAPHWSGEAPVHGAVEISVSQDGVRYTDPVVVGPAHTDAGRPDRDGRTFGELMMTEEARHVRYRTLDANGNPATLPGLSFAYIDATGGPTLGQIAPASLSGAPSRPPIITRDQWGAAQAYGGWDGGTHEWEPEYRTVKHLIIHHSVTPQFRDPLVEIRSIHYYHAVTRGWGDIGYNYLVDFLGNVYEGRKGGDNVVGGHAYQYAYGSAGICSMGSFALGSSTPEAIAALVWICAWLGRKLDPLGRRDFHDTPNCPVIAGHRDVNASTCPGDGLYADLPYIRTAVAEVIAGTRNAGVPSGFGPGDVIETAVENANLRSRPSTNASIEARLPLGKVMTIIEGPTTTGGYAWYRVSGDRSAGWLASTTFRASAAAPPHRDYPLNARVEIAANPLNLRSQPSLQGNVVARLPQGDTATVVGGPESGGGIDWLKLDTNLGTGWAAQQFVAPSGRASISSRFTTGDAVRVTTDPLNLRTDTSTSARVIARLWSGTVGTVIGGPRRSAGVTWVQIRTSHGTGWAAEQYLKETDAPAPAPVDGKFSPGDEVRVDTDALNLRSNAGLDSRVLTVLYTGAGATVTDGPIQRDNLLWYEVATTSSRGWATEAFLASADSSGPATSGFEPGTSISVAANTLNLRSDASISASVLRPMTRGERGTVVGSSRQANGLTWVQARFGDATGWVATAYLGRSAASPSDSGDLAVGMGANVSSDNLNVRTSASLTAPVRGQLYTGDSVTIAEGPVERDGHTWFRVTGSRWNGWVVDVWLRSGPSDSIRIGSAVRVFDGELNMRSGPSTSDPVSSVLPDGAIVEVLDGPERSGGHEWYRVTSSRYGTGWAVATWLKRT